MAERRLPVGRSVEEPEKSSEAAGQMLEPGEEAGCGDDVGEEAAYAWRLILDSYALCLDAAEVAAESRMLRLRMLLV